MDRQASWRHEGGQFRRQRSSALQPGELQKPLLRDGSETQQDIENRKHVHWSPSTKSFTGRVPGFERPPETACGGAYLKSMVYGGLDAIVTSFALVASVSGSGIGSGAVLVLGFANLIADGISMGFGDYLSSKTEQNYAAYEKKIVDWDVEDDLHAQALNMVEVYETYGMVKNDAEEVVKIFTKYKDLLAAQKMTMQNGLLPPDDDESAWKNGLVTFISFICFGCAPLLSFVLLNPFTNNVNFKFAAACLVTTLTLILLGIFKARISGEKWLGSILSVLGNGGFAAGAAYGISWSLNNIFGINEP